MSQPTWYASSPHIIKKLALFCVIPTGNCFGSKPFMNSLWSDALSLTCLAQTVICLWLLTTNLQHLFLLQANFVLLCGSCAAHQVAFRLFCLHHIHRQWTQLLCLKTIWKQSFWHCHFSLVLTSLNVTGWRLQWAVAVFPDPTMCSANHYLFQSRVKL